MVIDLPFSCIRWADYATPSLFIMLSATNPDDMILLHAHDALPLLLRADQMLISLAQSCSGWSPFQDAAPRQSSKDFNSNRKGLRLVPKNEEPRWVLLEPSMISRIGLLLPTICLPSFLFVPFASPWHVDICRYVLNKRHPWHTGPV